jgi:hypothetical protein
MVANVSTTVTIDLIDEITVIAGPILTTMTWIDMIIVATTAAMTGATTTVAMIATTGMTTIVVIVVMIATTTSATTNEMINAMIDVAETTTITTTMIGRNELHRLCPKGQPQRRVPEDQQRLSSSSVVAKRSNATDRTDQTLEKLGKLTLKTRGLCVGPDSQSLSLGKIIGFTSMTPGPTCWSLTLLSTGPSCLRPLSTGAVA